VLNWHGGGVVYSISLSPDGALAAVAGGDKTARVWSVRSDQQTAVSTGHDGLVPSVSFSHDGTLVAIASGDETTLLYVALSLPLKCRCSGDTKVRCSRLCSQALGRVYLRHCVVELRAYGILHPEMR